MTETNLLERMFGALTCGDMATAKACYTSDAVIWHSFDRVPQSLTEAAADWEKMITHFPVLEISSIRRQPTPTGFVQQHVWTAQTADGTRKSWDICVVAAVDGGLIARLEEYLDRAGSF